MPSTLVAHATNDGSAAFPALETLQDITAQLLVAGPQAQFYSAVPPRRVLHIGWYGLLAFGALVYWRYLDHDNEDYQMPFSPLYADTLVWHFNSGSDVQLEAFYV